MNKYLIIAYSDSVSRNKVVLYIKIDIIIVFLIKYIVVILLILYYIKYTKDNIYIYIELNN